MNFGAWSYFLVVSCRYFPDERGASLDWRDWKAEEDRKLYHGKRKVVKCPDCGNLVGCNFVAPEKPPDEKDWKESWIIECKD